MLLAIDAGNTTVHFAVFRGENLVKEWRVETSGISDDRSISRRVSGYRNISKVIVSSVVPRLNRFIRRQFPGALFVNHKNAGIKIRTKKPAEVGADRLVDARAVHELYGGPAIIIDFGTATTFDIINRQGEYLGGVIAPGIMMARNALYEQTARLPLVSLKAPRQVIGKSTVAAMQSGLVFGYVAMVEGLIKRISSEFGIRNSSLKVIATGGLAGLICKYTKVVDRIDPKLTLKGLRSIGGRA